MNFTIDTPKTWDEICSEPWAKEVEFRKGNAMSEIKSLETTIEDAIGNLKEKGAALEAARKELRAANDALCEAILLKYSGVLPPSIPDETSCLNIEIKGIGRVRLFDHGYGKGWEVQLP